MGSRSCRLHSTAARTDRRRLPVGWPRLVVDAGQDLGHRHRGHPHRGQLDPQRQTVETGAELGQHRLVVAVQDEVRPPRPGPLDEQATGVVGPQGVDRPHRLARDAERLPAGGHDPEVCAPAVQRRRQLGARVEDVVAVVEDEEDVAGVEVADQCVDRGPPTRAAYAQRAGRLGGHVRHRRQRRQIDQPGAIGRGRVQPPRQFDGQPGLAHATGPGQGQQPGPAQPLAGRPDHPLPPDQRGDGHREPRPVTHPRPPMASRYVWPAQVRSDEERCAIRLMTGRWRSPPARCGRSESPRTVRARKGCRGRGRRRRSTPCRW